MSKIFVINAENKKEPFSFKKIYRALRKSGVSRSLAKEVAERIQKIIYPGIKTSEIKEKVLEI